MFTLQGTKGGFDPTIDRGTFLLLDLLTNLQLNASHSFVVAISHNTLSEL